MKLSITYLDWDSRFFGYPVERIEIKEFLDGDYPLLIKGVEERGIKLAYLFIHNNKEILKRINDSGIPVVDTKIRFQKDHTSFMPSIQEMDIVVYSDQMNQYDKLLELTFLSGQYSRFKIDTNFRHNEFHRLYKEWIDQSLKKVIADEILVYKKNNEIKGFLTYFVIEKSLNIGLIAVDPLSHGYGIGKSLMKAAESIACNLGLRQIVVPTQKENTGAVNFYKACGFEIIEETQILHLWK